MAGLDPLSLRHYETKVYQGHVLQVTDLPIELPRNKIQYIIHSVTNNWEAIILWPNFIPRRDGNPDSSYHLGQCHVILGNEWEALNSLDQLNHCYLGGTKINADPALFVMSSFDTEPDVRGPPDRVWLREGPSEDIREYNVRVFRDRTQHSCHMLLTRTQSHLRLHHSTIFEISVISSSHVEVRRDFEKWNPDIKYATYHSQKAGPGFFVLRPTDPRKSDIELKYICRDDAHPVGSYATMNFFESLHLYGGWAPAILNRQDNTSRAAAATSHHDQQETHEDQERGPSPNSNGTDSSYEVIHSPRS
ncbi:hypothetical protein F5Y10DRAFT_269820 [Nemania abortiva]|nr:hypothetical protein F5Y10DRAFT_269820 [Nemania abortiva]